MQSLNPEQARARVVELERARDAMRELSESQPFAIYVDLLKIRLTQTDSKQYSMLDPYALMSAQGRKAGLREAILLPIQTMDEIKSEIAQLRAQSEPDQNATGTYPGGF